MFLAWVVGVQALLAPTPVRWRSALRAEESTALVPVNDETIKSSATVSSAAAGLVLGGPVFAVVAAIAGNYVAQQDGEVAEVVKGVGKVSLDVLNFFFKLNAKYDLTSKAGDVAAENFDKLKKSDADGNIEKVEGYFSTAKDKIVELNSEYDLVEKSKQALSYAGDLSIKAIDKSIELNDEYKIVDKVSDAVKDTVAKGVESAKKATA